MARTIPGKLETLVTAALAEMQANPGHQLPYQRRQETYGAFENQIGRNALGWLAVITARRVLSIFHEAFPDDGLPQQLLDTAIGVLRGQVDEETAQEMQELGYNAAGSAWGYDEDEVPWNADMAGGAAYHALKEARGQEPLQHLDKISVLGVVDLASGEMVAEYPQPIGGDQFADEELSQIDSSDVAAKAAVAFACSVEGPHCDPERLCTFWTWWLKEAIPEAWEIAHKEELDWKVSGSQ